MQHAIIIFASFFVLRLFSFLIEKARENKRKTKKLAKMMIACCITVICFMMFNNPL